MKKYDGVNNLDQLLDLAHGKVGSKKRKVYEKGVRLFNISEMLQDEQSLARYSTDIRSSESFAKA